MFGKLLDKFSEKIAGKASEIHEEWKKNFSTNPPPGLGQKIDMEKLRGSFQKGIPPLSRPEPKPKSQSPKRMFPKELKTKEITEIPDYLKDMSKTTIEIKDNEMEKVVKVIIDIGPNLASVMKDLANYSSSPGQSIDLAFGKFLQESAKNVVLVLKENTEKPKPVPEANVDPK